MRRYVSPDLISAVTDAARPLEPVYPLVFFDALRVKIRDEGLVRNKAIHIALGIRADETKGFSGFSSSTRKAPNSGCASAARICE
jgi:putative transposase